ncbi:MAG: FHA domain-containing protein, partial [Magnetococcales bacterium]|nr:FHA domain-containing protein [Magnetococcales bacterium]
MAKLVLKFKGMVRQEYPLNNPIVAIGRSATNDIFIDNLAVSRNHAQIVRKGDQFEVEDLNSNN